MIENCMRMDRRRLLGMAGIGALTMAIAPRLAYAITPDDIRKRGKLVVGVQSDNPPWGSIDLQGNSIGYDPEVAAYFAKFLGVDIEYVPLAVANRIPSLTTGKVDVLVASMAMTPERAKSVQYSRPYIANKISVLAAKNLVLTKQEDVEKYSIGVPKASIQDNLITQIAGSSGRVLRFDDDAATIQALLSGQVDAIGGNIFYINKLEQVSPNIYENKIELTSLYIGICTRLGEKEINASVNSFLDEIKSNGQLAALYTKWMQQDLPEFPASMPDVPFTAG